MNTLYIGLMWLAYYALHSAFAADGMKRFFAKQVPFAVPYYRAIYSFFAAVNFVLLAWFHMLIPSQSAFDTGWGTAIAAALCAFAGGIVFWKSAVQYGTSFLVREEFFETAHPPALRTEGVNSVVRHPLYSAILLMLLAMVLFYPKWKHVVFGLISACYIILGSLLEERKLVARYGERYTEYQRDVKMLIPYLF